MCRLLCVVLLVVGLPAGAMAGQLYKWVDQDGRLHYSDRHPGSLDNLREFEDLSYPDSQPQKSSSAMRQLAPLGGEPTIVAPQPIAGGEVEKEVESRGDEAPGQDGNNPEKDER